MKSKIKVLSITAEAFPFSKTGGLARSSYFLPKALNKIGHEVKLFSPIDPLTSQIVHGLKTDSGLSVVDGSEIVIPDNLNRKETNQTSRSCFVWEMKSTRKNQPTFLLDQKEFFGSRSQLYGYGDDYQRFYFFSVACLEWLSRQHLLYLHDKTLWYPDILHCHDWHTGYLIELARKNPRYEFLKSMPILLTIHNCKYQGQLNFSYFPDKKQDTGKSTLGQINDPKLLNQNPLLRGIIYADAISTVSPTHAKEILSKEYSFNLAPPLNLYHPKITGILNGLDFNEFNPAKDSAINSNFGLNNFQAARKKNKQFLQRQFNLPINANTPVFGYVGRLTLQKGLDTLMETLTNFLEIEPEAQFIFLGEGEEKYCSELSSLQLRFPKNISIHLQQNFALPRAIFAGADALLVPSNYEPGGIVVLEAMRYGCVPLVRKTGGMSDTVSSYDFATGLGNGFSYSKQDKWSLFAAMIQVMVLLKQPKSWQKLIKNCLTYKRTWDDAAIEYEKWFQTQIGLKKTKQLKRSDA